MPFGLTSAPSTFIRLMSEVLKRFLGNFMIGYLDNIWIEVGLFNGVIGEITNIVYKMATKPPNIPMHVIIHFENYNGPPCNQDEPK